MDSINEVMEAVKAYCKEKTSDATYAFYIKDIKAVSFENSKTVTLELRSDFVMGIVSDRYTALLQDAFKAILGFDVEIRYVVAPPEDGVKPGDDIAAVIGILTVGDGLSGYINGTMSDLGASTIIVSLQEKSREVSSDDMMSMMAMKQPEASDLITPEMVSAMEENFGARLAATGLSQSAGSGKAKDGRLYANVSATGVNEGYFTVNDVKLSAGRLLQQKDDDG